MNREEILRRLKEYKKQNSSKYGIQTMGIFGSVARGDYSAESDIDICVSMSEPNPFTIVHIKEELEDEFIRHVDIVRFRDKMNSFLKKRIEKECIYV